MDESQEISSPEQYHAFGHPLRQRILFALGREPATISQLATVLGSQKGSIAHHMKVLRDAGLVQLGQSRQVRGGTEQYYERTSRKFRFTGPGAAAQTARSMHVVADQMAASPSEPFLLLRQLWFTPQQAEALVASLASLADGLEEAEQGGPRYAVVLGVYETPAA